MLLGIAATFGQRLDPYADDPDWYRPGHPLEPAEPAAIRLQEGFKVERVLSVPKETGSISVMTTAPNGDLLVTMQHRPGIYRVTPSTLGKRGGTVFEKMEGAAEEIGWAQGLLWAFDSLYVVVAEKNESLAPGLYRLLDTNSDGRLDRTIKLFEFRGAGEHGPHGLVVGPDEKSIYMVCGNGTPVPESIEKRRTIRTEGPDRLIPPGFGSSEYTEAGWVFRFDPDGGNAEMIAGGLRNSYDIAFNRNGDLFTFDSDMEYDLGTPWYRPTRICWIPSGGEFGWRANASKWPEWYQDSVPPVLNVGPASPTGVVFGYETNFPEPYREALFALDWTFATIYAVHLEPNGVGYQGRAERFASGIGLPLTDVVAGADGALYFSVGGRRLGSAIYRIWYDGEGDVFTGRAKQVKSDSENRQLLRELEKYHGRIQEDAVSKIWANLGHEDPAIRYAARVALEWQPISEWKERASAETDRQASLTALTALARHGDDADLSRVLKRVGKGLESHLDESMLLESLRIAEIALARGGDIARSIGKQALEPSIRWLPHPSERVNRELARLLAYLNVEQSISPILDLMEADTGTVPASGFELVERNSKYASPILGMAESPPLSDRMHYAQVLNWMESGWSGEQRRRYFRLVVDALQSSKGGKGYSINWGQILDTAKKGLTPSEYQRVSGEWVALENKEPLPKPNGPGRIWELDYLVERVRAGFGPRDFDNGERMFAAASCLSCHGMQGKGGVAGPDLTAVGQRFTISDLLDSIIHPSKAISDQYAITVFELENGETITGRVISKDARKTTVATNALNPSQIRSVDNSLIVKSERLATSTMPPGLLNALNENEVLDLMAYLISGGDSNHALYDSK